MEYKLRKSKILNQYGGLVYALEVFDEQRRLYTIELPDKDLSGGYSISSDFYLSSLKQYLIVVIGQHFMGDHEYEYIVYRADTGAYVGSIDSGVNLYFNEDETYLFVYHLATDLTDVMDLKTRAFLPTEEASPLLALARVSPKFMTYEEND